MPWFGRLVPVPSPWMPGFNTRLDICVERCDTGYAPGTSVFPCRHNSSLFNTYLSIFLPTDGAVSNILKKELIFGKE
jgi:hypothetical protein